MLNSNLYRLKSDLTDTFFPVGSLCPPSLTLDTENKVIARYGGNSWALRSDLMVIGAGNLYSAGSTGGQRSVQYTPSGSNTRAIAPTLAHAHGGVRVNWDDQAGGVNSLIVIEGALSLGVGNYPNNYACVDRPGKTNTKPAGVIGDAQYHNHGWTGHNATIQTMPPYKAYYIWERTA